MLMTTRYMPALPRLPQRADPWPSWQDSMRTALEDFNFWLNYRKYTHCERTFPALAYCEHKMAGVSYCALPVRKAKPTPEQLTITAWLERHKQPVPPAIARRKPLPRQKGRLETWLDNHRGALAFWRKKPAPAQKPVYTCDNCHQPTPEGELWYANEQGRICGLCWLEQESWAR